MTVDSNFPPVLWLDLETTGLERDAKILEMSFVMTSQGPSFRTLDVFLAIIRHDEIPTMDPTVTDMHRKSGLLDDIQTVGESWQRAETRLVSFLDRWVPDGMRVVPAGSGIHYDIPYLQRDLPWLTDRLHYFHYDVGVLRRFARMKTVQANINQLFTPHRAVDDIFQHIREARILLERIN